MFFAVSQNECLAKKQKQALKTRHACLMLKESMFVPNMLEKLLKNSSSIKKKYDRCKSAKVRET